MCSVVVVATRKVDTSVGVRVKNSAARLVLCGFMPLLLQRQKNAGTISAEDARCQLLLSSAFLLDVVICALSGLESYDRVESSFDTSHSMEMRGILQLSSSYGFPRYAFF